MKQLLTLLLSLFTTFSVSGQSDPWAKVDVGDKVPEFEVRMMDGKVVRSADLEGKVVWICLWASWCPSCRREFKWLSKDEEFAKLLENKDFVFLPIAREESLATVKLWLKERGYPYISGEDPERKIYSLFAEQEIPRNVIVGRDGVVVLHSSACSRKTIAKVVEKAKEIIIY